VGALDGVKVVEVGLLVQGPQATATMREWGAEVVKVELPFIGDQARWLPSGPLEPRSGYFIGCNRGKQSVTVDLRTPDGREVFLRLCEWADVVVSNFAPGTMERWGLGHDDVAARNPRAIYAAASTFGTKGTDAAREGADLSAQAAGGLVSTTGTDGDDFAPVGITIADHIGSQNLLAGVLAALFARERTGRGQSVTTSLVGGQIWAQASEYTACLLRGRDGNRRSNRGHPLIPLIYGVFRTADGWIGIVGVAGPLRKTFFELIGRPDLEDAFPQPIYWDDAKAELFPQIDAALATGTTAEWCDRFAAAGIRHAPVRDHAAVIADGNAWANGWFASVDGVDVVAVPVGFSDTPGSPPSTAPELGEHTEAVLRALGYDDDALAALRTAGAI
jgi:crotonobetainyl-CoA:carnitine CoA-transferase CaiB-like acyl-CoA transferase